MARQGPPLGSPLRPKDTSSVGSAAERSRDSIIVIGRMRSIPSPHNKLYNRHSGLDGEESSPAPGAELRLLCLESWAFRCWRGCRSSAHAGLWVKTISNAPNGERARTPRGTLKPSADLFSFQIGSFAPIPGGLEEGQRDLFVLVGGSVDV